jgi:hypothetical protein
MSIRIAILVSGQGRGSNMAAIIDACQRGEIDGKVVLVIGTRRRSPRPATRYREGCADGGRSPRVSWARRSTRAGCCTTLGDAQR